MRYEKNLDFNIANSYQPSTDNRLHSWSLSLSKAQHLALRQAQRPET